MDRVRIGLIGTGSIAQVAHLPILSRISDVELIALCETDDTKLKIISAK